jgi:hypothetical protein
VPPLLPIQNLTLHLEGGGESTNRGTVLINGFPLCDDAWGAAAADVVCRTLGFPSMEAATDRAQFGNATRPFIASQLVCTGKENSLEVTLQTPAIACLGLRVGVGAHRLHPSGDSGGDLQG